jgi:NADH-quinone oxidoreductase subunit J
MMLLAQAAEAGAGNTSEIVLFWVFAVLALGSALAVITMRNIVHGALMLVLNLLAIAGLYLTLESAFLSIIQVLVYAGAIMVLFLFVIMLLGVDNDDLLTSDTKGRIGAVVAALALAGALTFAFLGPYTGPASVCGPDAPVATAGDVDCTGLSAAYGDDDRSGVAFLGRSMFTRYTFPFELSALLLTVATIGAVILARKRDLAPEDFDEADTDGSDGSDPDDDGVSVAVADGERVLGTDDDPYGATGGRALDHEHDPEPGETPGDPDRES